MNIPKGYVYAGTDFLKCCLCGLQSPGVAMAVKVGDFEGEYHLIPRCADTEACWQRMREQMAQREQAKP